MSKKDFIALANVLRGTRPSVQGFARSQWTRDKDALAEFCKRQNPRFKRERWLGYIEGTCGPSGGRVKVPA